VVKRLAWYELDDEDRRVAAAQTVVWLACLGPMLGVVVAVVATLFGNRTFVVAIGEHPLGVLLGFAWVGLYAVAGYLIGQRRAEGAMIGLAVFAYSLIQSVRYGHALSLPAGFALLGIALMVRAWPALEPPFRSGHARLPPPGGSDGTERTDKTGPAA
jgi:hypothetical protein